MQTAALCAAALVLLITIAPSAAGDLAVAEVVPADVSPQLAELRLRPTIVTASLAPGFSAREQLLPPRPEAGPALTPELLAAYVARQQQLRAFDGFAVKAEPALTPELLTAYIARKQNPALEAISAIDIAAPPTLNETVLARYVDAGFLPTEKKIELADDERHCLTQAIYHEARGESLDGQMAVANVILNRALNAKYPSTICGVVFQNADKGRYRCQFTFACDGRSDQGKERKAWNRAMEIAETAFAEFQRGDSLGVLPQSTLFYHTTAVAPAWSHTYRRVAAIGSHIFYAPL